MEAQDNRQLVVLGVAMVEQRSAATCKPALEQIVEALRGHPVAELLDHEIEV